MIPRFEWRPDLCRGRPARPRECRSGQATARKSAFGSGESAESCSGTGAWGRTGSRMDIHAVQNSKFSRFIHPGIYQITLLIPKFVFNKNYPKNPINFGEKLRRKRIDSGLQIKELAKMIGVTEDTLINWEKRGVSPPATNLKRIIKWIDDLSINEMKK